jgi:transcriptional regulator with XRE-family HTH domain
VEEKLAVLINNLKMERIKQDLSVETVAKLSGFTPEEIWSLEEGWTIDPELSMLEDYAETIGFRLDLTVTRLAATPR